MPAIYSFLVAIVWFNIAMLFVAVLSRKTYFLVKYSTSVLLVCAALGVIRMLLPLDFTFTHVIRSYKIMPIARDIFKSSIPLGPVHLQTRAIIIGLWGVGTIAVSIKTAYQLFAEHQARKKYTSVENEQVQRICTKIGLDNAKIIVSPDVRVPMMTGIFKAHIYLPKMDLTDDQWEMIISHEYQHFRSHDTLIKLFYLLLLALFWWNPAVHKFRNTLDDLLELRCDANLSRNMDDLSKSSYLGSILAVIKKTYNTKCESSPLASSSLLGATAEPLIKRRFQAVLSDTKTSRVMSSAMVIILLVLFLSSYLIVLQPAGYPPGDEMEAGVEITPENAYILVQEDGSMQLYVDGEFLWDVYETDLYDDLHSVLPICEERD